MLGQLHIKNIGIIDEITINFEDGLNILTGETGAGKSLIIDSIGAITGMRFSKDIIKQGETEAFVEACFFGEKDIILKREFYQNGRNICKINGNMVPLSKFKEVGESLIDIHGQHDNQSLLKPKTHLPLLDAFAGEELSKLLADYKQMYQEYKKTKFEIEKNFADPIERARRLDLLKYQQEEINNSHLQIGEEEALNAKRIIIMNSEKIAKALNMAYYQISESSLESVENGIHEMSAISHLDAKFENILKTLNDAYYSLKDASYEMASAVEDSNFDENEQKEIEERLDLIFSLKRKYGRDIESILNYNKKIEDEVNILENSDEMVKELQQKRINLEKQLHEKAEQITACRKQTAIKIEKKINEQLQQLEMKKAYIQFEFCQANSFQEDGMDEVQILISTNVGEGLKPLSKIASGGELSRVMLAIKSVLCVYDKVPTMIFDEIDTGISGQAAKAVAEKMKMIGNTHQVICVTHLPIIAASGDVNFYIEKIIEKNRTKTKVTKLNEESTIQEIARILAGNEITKAVLAHAKEIRHAV